MSWVPHRRSDRVSCQVTAAVWAISDYWTFCCEGRDEWAANWMVRPCSYWQAKLDRGCIRRSTPTSCSSAPSSSQGPEWIASRATIAAVGAKTACITLSRPWENGFIESFNAGLRDELLGGDLLFAQASQHRDRELAMSLPHRAPAPVIGLQTAGAESLRATRPYAAFFTSSSPTFPHSSGLRPRKFIDFFQ
jgi:hypothetical protein